MIRYRAAFALPVAGAPIRDGTVAVDDGLIAYVGPAAGAPAGDAVDLGDVVLMPGLVNAHTHLELTVMRGFLEDLEFPAWIMRLTAAKRSVLTRDMLLDSALLGIQEGIRAGITSYADTCDSGVAFDAMLRHGVRGIMYQEVFGPDPSQCTESMAALREKVDALIPRQTSLVRVGISPHAPYTVSDELFIAAAKYARSESLPMAIHIAEAECETQLVCDASGVFADGLRRRGIPVQPRANSPIRLLEQLGVLDARPLLIHCVRVDQDDVNFISAADCGVAHCPASNAKLGHGVAPLLEMLDAGIDVGLGSDSMASNNRMDILAEARLAVLMQRARSGSAVGLTAATALELATLGGARSLGIAHTTGSLEVGKSADLAAFSLDRVGPHLSPEAAALFALNGAHATFVAVAGRVLLRAGELVDADPHLSGRVQKSADALLKWLEAGSRAPAPSDPLR